MPQVNTIYQSNYSGQQFDNTVRYVTTDLPSILNTKINQSQLDGVNILINNKADKSQLNSMNIAIESKVNSSQITSLNSTIQGQLTSMNTMISNKASSQLVENLNNNVSNLKTNVSTLQTDMSNKPNKGATFTANSMVMTDASRNLITKTFSVNTLNHTLIL